MKERRSAGYLFALPSVAILFLVAVCPIVFAVWLSLRRVILVFHEDRFVGLANYRFLLGDSRFLAALGNTAYFTAVSLVIEVGLGLPIALLLHRAFFGRGVLRAAVLVPWAIPTVVSARMWAWMWNPDYGLITRALHITEIDVLGTPAYAMHAAIVVDVWKSTPFVALLLLAGLAGIPEELYRAARVDGASTRRIIFAVTLPLLRPALAVTVLFRGLDALRVFDAIYVLTGGGPANTTETLSIYAYKTMMRSGDFGYGSTLSVATFIVVVLVSVLYLRTIGRSAGVGQ